MPTEKNVWIAFEQMKPLFIPIFTCHRSEIKRLDNKRPRSPSKIWIYEYSIISYWQTHAPYLVLKRTAPLWWNSSFVLMCVCVCVCARAPIHTFLHIPLTVTIMPLIHTGNPHRLCVSWFQSRLLNIMIESSSFTLWEMHACAFIQLLQVLYDRYRIYIWWERVEACMHTQHNNTVTLIWFISNRLTSYNRCLSVRVSICE